MKVRVSINVMCTVDVDVARTAEAEQVAIDIVEDALNSYKKHEIEGPEAEMYDYEEIEEDDE